MKKVIKNEQNKLRKEIYIVLISVCLFVGAIFFSEKYEDFDFLEIKSPRLSKYHWKIVEMSSRIL